MNVHWVRIAIAGVIGALAPVWWSWFVSVGAYQIYLAAGSPEGPTSVLALSSVLLPSLGAGSVAGWAVDHLGAGTFAGWLAFIAGFVAASAIWLSLDGVVQLVASPGTWIFVVASLAWSLRRAVFARRRRHEG
jgi:hypothetical protein